MNQYLVVGVVFLVVIALLATNKKLVETLKNIYKIEELRKRVIYTIGLLLVYRLGSFVVIPGINPNALGGQSHSGIRFRRAYERLLHRYRHRTRIR